MADYHSNKKSYNDRKRYTKQKRSCTLNPVLLDQSNDHSIPVEEPPKQQMIRRATTGQNQSSMPMYDEREEFSNQSRSLGYTPFDPKDYTDKDIDRLERFLKLQERAAQLIRPGHTYGKANVSGKATLYQGNAYDSIEGQLFSSQNTYGQLNASKESTVISGDFPIPKGMKFPNRPGRFANSEHQGGWEGHR